MDDESPVSVSSTFRINEEEFTELAEFDNRITIVVDVDVVGTTFVTLDCVKFTCHTSSKELESILRL